MKCAAERRKGRCRRDAVAIVDAGAVLAPMCADCVLRTARRVTGLTARSLRRPGAGLPRTVIALTCTT